MWKIVLALLFVIPTSGFAQSNIADRAVYRWTFAPDTTDLWQVDLTEDNFPAYVFGYTKWWWEIVQTASANHSGTAQDTVQFSLWGRKFGVWDSLASFPGEPDSATVGLKYPKHHSFDIGVDADTFWVYDIVRMQARFLSADTGFTGAAPIWEIELRVTK